MTKSKLCVGIDLGGTNIAVGIVDLEEKNIVAKGSVKTKAPRSCEEISADAVELIKSLCGLQLWK